MDVDWHSVMLLAQEAGGAAPAGRGPQPFEFIPLGVAILLAVYFIMVRPEKKKMDEKRKLLAALKKNDRVVTTGGLYGIVANIKPDDDEVVLKVDEEKDVKIRVTRTSIERVLTPKETAAST
jgi:preprotein translocase subunit YajC